MRASNSDNQIQGLSDYPCTFKFDGQNVEYDLSILKDKVYQYKADDHWQTKYRFAFCGPIHGESCKGELSSSFSLTEDGKCYKSFGTANQVNAYLSTDVFNKISLKYSGGDPCPTKPGSFLSTTFHIGCAKDAAGGAEITHFKEDTSNSCTIEYTIASPAGCGVERIVHDRPIGAGWVVFIVFVCLFSVYMLLGYLYKRQKFGSRGVEAIPNIDTWRRIGGVFGNAKAAISGKKDPHGDGYLLAEDDGSDAQQFPYSPHAQSSDFPL